jgi:hypothetical protein
VWVGRVDRKLSQAKPPHRVQMPFKGSFPLSTRLKRQFSAESHATGALDRIVLDLADWSGAIKC